MRDDRVGPRALRALRGRLGPGVALADVGTSVLGLLDLLDGQGLLVLVDACAGRAAPGEVSILVPDLDAPLPTAVGTHQIGPVETLVVARELYPERLPRSIVLVLVETADLPERAEAEACARATAAVLGTVRSWQREHPCARAARRPSGERRGPCPRRSATPRSRTSRA